MKLKLKIASKIFIVILSAQVLFAMQELTLYPWLNDSYEGFVESYDTSISPVSGKKAGCYPVGNGLVFGGVGVYDPVCNMDYICGPYYDEPFFGREEFQVLINGEKVKLHKQSIRWVKGTDIVISTLVNDRIEVTNIDFAPPDTKALLRIFSVKNLTEEKLEDVKLVFRYVIPNGKTAKISQGQDKELLVKHDSWVKKVHRVGFLKNQEKAVYNKDYILPLSLEAKEEFSNLRYIAIDSDEAGAEKTYQEIKSRGSALLEPTKKYWNDWLADTMEFKSDNPKVDYVLETQKVILKSQQAHTGGFSPMYGYAYTWARDSNGPVLFMLRIGKYKEAKDILDFFYKIARHGGFVAGCSRVTYNYDETRNSAVDFDWSHVGVPSAEVPSWIIKQHYWYYTYTGDIGLMKERFPFLKRCLEGQSLTKDYKLPFQTDETYMWTLQSRTYKLLSYPNYYIGLNAYSADSAFEWVAAAENMAEMAKAFGDEKQAKELLIKADQVRGAIDKFYWQEKEGYYAPALSIYSEKYQMPHANIGMNPFWCGYADEQDKKAVRSFYNQAGYLLKDNYLLKTTPSVEIFSGLTPGMLLYNLAFLGDANAENALTALLRCSSPSGDFSELYDGNGDVWVVPSWGDGCYGRARPWEGGVNADAMLFYLTGFTPSPDGIFKLSPGLPSNMNSYSVKNIRLLEQKLDFSVKEETKEQKNIRTYEIINRSMKAIKVTLKTPKAREKIESAMIGGVECKDEGAEFTREIPGLAALIAEIAYTPGPKPPAMEKKGFKKPWTYYGKSDIVYFTVNDKYAPFSIGKNLRITAIDMQLPLSANDIFSALIDDKTKTIKTKAVIFGPKAFSAGTLHFKSFDFWSNWEMQSVFKKYTDAGGIVIFMSEPAAKEGVEVKPAWLTKLLDGGGWEAHWKNGSIMASDDFMDIGIKNVEIEDIALNSLKELKEKKAEVYNRTGKNGAGIQRKPADGKKFTGYLELPVKTAKGRQHTVIITAPASVNFSELGLEVKSVNQFVKLSPVRRGIKNKLAEIEYLLPSQYAGSDTAVVRIGNIKSKKYITLERVRINKIEITGKNPLADVLGFKSGELVGKTYGSLKYTNMVAPLRLVGENQYAALVMKKTGKGMIIRTQLGLSKMEPAIISLLNYDVKEKVLKYLEKNGKN